MMKKFKTLGMFMISLFILSSICSVYNMEVAGVSNFSAKDKLPAFLSDVLGLDMSKYQIVNERGATQYVYGNSVEVDNYVFELVDEKGGEVTVRGHFYNGVPNPINIREVDGSVHYVSSPGGSLEGLRNVFERYVVFAQKYGIATVDASLALSLFDKAPSDLPKSHASAVRVASDSLTLYVSQEGFGFGYIVEGVEVLNRSLGIVFTADGVTFHDTFGLYSVSNVNVFSEEEFTGFAFGLAQEFCDNSRFYHVNAEGIEEEVRPDWSRMRSEIDFKMIPGQIYNNPINNELLEQGAGVTFSADRDALTLYPFWSAVFYFSWPIGNIYGVQVGVWGDTGEVAYCWEYGFLGGSQYPTDGASSGTPSSYYYMLGLVVIALITIVAIVVFVKKNRK